MKKVLGQVALFLVSKEVRPFEVRLAKAVMVALGVKLGVDFAGK